MTPDPIYNEDGKYIVHNVPQAVIDHLDEQTKEMLDLRPIKLLDESPGKTIFFSTPSGRDDFAFRYLSGANVGKSMSTLKHLENMVAINHVALGHGDRTLFGEFPHPEPQYPDYPTFSWKEVFPLDYHNPLLGYYGEARMPADRWLNEGFHLGYYGFQASAMWDHYEWLGLGENENEFRRNFDRRHYLRVKVPARRYAGLNAYELQNLFHLKQPKPIDCAWWIVRFVTETYYYRERLEWFHSLIQAGLDAAFKVVKKPPVRMSARPRLKR